MPIAAAPASVPPFGTASRVVALVLALLLACVLPFGAVAGAVAGADPVAPEAAVEMSAADDPVRLERTPPLLRHRLATVVRRARSLPLVAAVVRTPRPRADDTPGPRAAPVAATATRRGPPAA